MSTMSHMTSGKDLKMKRVAADVLVKDVAKAMGVTDSRVSRIENSRLVTVDAEQRYLAALLTCSTNSTTPSEAA